MVISLSGPSFKMVMVDAYQDAHAQVLLLDMSENMLVSDVRPTRLNRARFKLIDYFKSLSSGNVGLVAFTNWPYVVFPLTSDTDAAQSLVPQLRADAIPSQGYNLKRALSLGQKLIEQIGQRKGDIILMTAGQPDQAAIEKVKSLHRLGFRVFVWAIGKVSGGPVVDSNGSFSRSNTGQLAWKTLPAEKLRHFAQLGGGKYIAMTADHADITTLLQSTGHVVSASSPHQSVEVNVWLDQGVYLCWLVLLIGLVFYYKENWT